MYVYMTSQHCWFNVKISFTVISNNFINIYVLVVNVFIKEYQVKTAKTKKKKTSWYFKRYFIVLKIPLKAGSCL